MRFNKTISAIVLAFVGLILCVSAQAQRTATATPTVANGFVIAITVTDGGSGYTTAPTVTIFGGGGSGAIALATVLNGSVEKVIVQNAGSGYSGTPIVVIAAPPSPKPPFSDGLVAYYPFNGNANDASESVNNGTIHGATLTTDRFGNLNSAYYFNGTSDYITILYAPANDLASQSTISFWINPSAGAGTPPGNNRQIISKWGGPGASYSIGLKASGELYVATSAGGTPSSTVIDTSTMPTNEWNQVVLVRDQSSFRLYRDSILRFATNMVQPIQNSPVNLTFAREEASNYAYYPGKLDDVRIYNRALSAQEVEDIYAYEAPEQPSLTINVETVRVTMHVKPTKKYQLQASLDLNTWTNAGAIFTATTSEVTQQFNAIEVGRYFRLSEVQ